MRVLALLMVLLFLCTLPIFPQGAVTKEMIVEMAKSGVFDKMSADEIRQKLKDAGITEEEAIRYARDRNIDFTKYLSPSAMTIDTTKGGQAVSTQVTPIINVGVPNVSTPGGSSTILSMDTSTRIAPDQRLIPKGRWGLEYFGYNLFKKLPSAFEPSSVGQVDQGYVIGPGDNILLSVWGQTEFQYQLEVDKEGKVFIPNAGQIFVSGISLKNLQDKLRNQLSKYYSGLTADPPTVFLDATITKVRPLRIFVMGELTQPGGYVISSNATVFNALYAVGGPTEKGSLRNINVMRAGKRVATIDLYDYLLRGDQTTDVRLENNDIVFISPRGKTVSIRGEVRRPAIYELKDGETLSSLIAIAGGLTPTAYAEKGQIERIKPFDERKGDVIDRMVIDVPLKDVLAKGGKVVAMADGDDVEVFSILKDMKNYVVLDGPVWRPGRYELTKAPTIKALITVGEGLQPKTYLPVGHIVRENPDLISTKIIPFNLGKLLDGSLPDITLQARDTVYIYSAEVVEIKGTYVSIQGEVKKPGKYPLRDNMTLADAILLAGGYTQEAYLLQGEISRVNPGGMKGDTLAILLHPSLPREFSKVGTENVTDGSREITASDFFLQHRDNITIFPNPEYKEQQNVTVTGDITFPGVYSIAKRGELLSEILTRAGGPTKTSYFGGAEFTRGGKRLLLDFNEAFYNKNRLHDVLVFGEDRIAIPSRPHTVIVNGQVNNPGLLSFLDGDDVLDYINRAGGLTDSSNYAMLIKPSGETQRVNFGFLRSNPSVPEGSTIIVTKVPPPPPDQKGFDISGTIKDTFAIVSSAATLAFLIYQVTK